MRWTNFIEAHSPAPLHHCDSGAVPGQFSHWPPRRHQWKIALAKYPLGFTGETDDDAAELVEFVKQYKIGRLGAFTYSPEEGTSGFELENDVPAKVARARHKAVLAARDEVLRDSQGALVGETLEVLIDEAASKAHPIAIGRTLMDAPEVDLIVRLEKCKAAVGTRVKAEILGLDEESNLVARPVK